MKTNKVHSFVFSILVEYRRINKIDNITVERADSIASPGHLPSEW